MRGIHKVPVQIDHGQFPLWNLERVQIHKGKSLIRFRLTSSIIRKIMHKIAFFWASLWDLRAIYWIQALYLKFLTQRLFVAEFHWENVSFTRKQGGICRRDARDFPCHWSPSLTSPSSNFPSQPGKATFPTIIVYSTVSCVDVLGIAIDFSSLTFHCIFLVWCAFCHALLQ